MFWFNHYLVVMFCRLLLPWFCCNLMVRWHSTLSWWFGRIVLDHLISKCLACFIGYSVVIFGRLLDYHWLTRNFLLSICYFAVTSLVANVLSFVELQHLLFHH